MFQDLRTLLSQEYDHIAALRRLPQIPEAPRMRHRLTQPGSIWRHLDVTPKVIMASIIHRFHQYHGGDYAD
jgi:hypothetical protein